MNSPAPFRTPSPRLLSLDALRGLDMLIILGLDALILLLAAENPDNLFLQDAARQMRHASWQGIRIYDMVFPVFVFIAGVSMSFSLKRNPGNPVPSGSILFKLWKRAAILILAGLLVNGALSWTVDMRCASVLGLIGLACAISGTCVILLQQTRYIAAAAISLAGLVTVLQFTGGDFTPAGSVNAWIDSRWCPGKLIDGTYDPEGLLCIISASALCLCGCLTGKFLQLQQFSTLKRALLMLAVGAGLFCTALLLDSSYPIIKKIWTGSFILAAWGAGLMALALFHMIMEGWKVQSWAFPLRVIGLNALTAYLVHALLNIHQLNHRIFTGLAELQPLPDSVFLAISLILLQWIILFAMYRRKLFIKL